MHSLAKFEPLISETISEWNSAELCMKLAEQVNYAVIFPAIKELRYGGRRIVDALELIVAGGDEARIRELLLDAKFDCNRARHDAVDAAISRIAIDLDALLSLLGPAIVLQTIPSYPTLIKLLQDAQGRIANSRRNRQRRDAIYEDIETEVLEKVVALFHEVLASKEAASKAAQRDRMQKRIAYFVGLIGTALALVSLVLAWTSNG